MAGDASARPPHRATPDRIVTGRTGHIATKKGKAAGETGPPSPDASIASAPEQQQDAARGRAIPEVLT